MSALEMLRLYRARELSPVEAMRSVIERVEAYEPHIHATYLYAPERALERGARVRSALGEGRADRSARRRAGRRSRTISRRRGEPKPVGTAAEDMSPQKADAPPAQRLREAGAIIFTKTTMPDYGMLSSGLSSFHPLARNPWKLDRNPGGSSAGAGAAAAALYGPLHLGTDIGGSVRLPAGWCGIFGLKPSGGRIPIDPPYIGRVAGPMTRDVDDAALMMATLSLPDVRDYASLKYEKLDWIVEPAPLKGLRVGLLLEAGCGAAADARSQGRRRARREGFRGRGRACRAAQAVPDPGDARRARQVLARARAQRHQRAAGRAARSRAAVHPRLGGIRGGVFWRRGVSRLRPDPGDAQSGGRGDAGRSTAFCRRPRR